MRPKGTVADLVPSPVRMPAGSRHTFPTTKTTPTDVGAAKVQPTGSEVMNAQFTTPPPHSGQQWKSMSESDGGVDEQTRVARAEAEAARREVERMRNMLEEMKREMFIMQAKNKGAAAADASGATTATPAVSTVPATLGSALNDDALPSHASQTTIASSETIASTTCANGDGCEMPAGAPSTAVAALTTGAHTEQAAAASSDDSPQTPKKVTCAAANTKAPAAAVAASTMSVAPSSPPTSTSGAKGEGQKRPEAGKLTPKKPKVWVDNRSLGREQTVESIKTIKEFWASVEDYFAPPQPSDLQQLSHTVGLRRPPRFARAPD